LSAALVEEEKLRNELRDADVSFASQLRPMPLAQCRLDDPESAASKWLKNARDHGLIDKEVR
jgi:hypothetical protein